jgi:DNA-binding NarL/FixJ family response regulator
VLVIDGDVLAARALRNALEEAGARVIAEVASARDGVDLARHHVPDVVFIAALVGGVEGVRLIERLGNLDLDTRCVLLTLDPDAELGLAAIRAGGRGCIAKQDVLEGLDRVLEAVMSEELVCSRSLATQMVTKLVRVPHPGPGYRPVRSPLTTREWEIFDLLCDGLPPAEVGDRLVISRETVRTHVRNVMRKLGTRSRAEAIAKAADLRAGDRATA